ncbi:hypothetical protein N7495_009750 [Penicillium taxi]|uniref:uncharacterized protein n=1 Tax=Penicillium taxi TaxID=168475 RepID=UPI00254562A2|nr:uncharacterized protein N7495_009750 [Penicillium taxi]KAJ5885240.1 hypothetical protein N7495_009750 [Penicillium taxi]
MDIPVSFGGMNSGLQVGINHGRITAEFHLPPKVDVKLPIAYGAGFDSYVDQHEAERHEDGYSP